MGAELPSLTREAFSDQLGIAPVSVQIGPTSGLGESVIDGLFAHYQLLRQWNRRLSLVGPGTAADVVARHYGEALAALPLLDALCTDAECPDTVCPDTVRPDTDCPDGQPKKAGGDGNRRRFTLVDVGSGAGFPGFVLAVARPDLQVVLVEARTRKWSFLRAATRVASEAIDTARGAGNPYSSATAPSLSCSSLNARIARPLPRELPAVIDVVTSRAVRLEHEWLEPLIEHSPAVRFLLWQGADHELPSLLREVRVAHLGGGSNRRIVEAVAKEVG